VILLEQRILRESSLLLIQRIGSDHRVLASVDFLPVVISLLSTDSDKDDTGSSGNDESCDDSGTDTYGILLFLDKVGGTDTSSSVFITSARVLGQTLDGESQPSSNGIAIRSLAVLSGAIVGNFLVTAPLLSGASVAGASIVIVTHNLGGVLVLASSLGIARVNRTHVPVVAADVRVDTGGHAIVLGTRVQGASVFIVTVDRVVLAVAAAGVAGRGEAGRTLAHLGIKDALSGVRVAAVVGAELVVVAVDGVQNLALSVGEIALSGVALVGEGTVDRVEETLAGVAIASVSSTLVVIVTGDWLGCAHSGNTLLWGTLVGSVTSLECVDTLSIDTAVISARIVIIAIDGKGRAGAISWVTFLGEARIDSSTISLRLVLALITWYDRIVYTSSAGRTAVTGTDEAVATEDVGSDTSSLGITELVGTSVVIVASVSGTVLALSVDTSVSGTHVVIVTRYGNVGASNGRIAAVNSARVIVVTEVGVDTWVTSIVGGVGVTRVRGTLVVVIAVTVDSLTSRVSVTGVNSARIAILAGRADIDVSASTNSVTDIISAGIVIVTVDADVRASRSGVAAVIGTVVVVVT